MCAECERDGIPDRLLSHLSAEDYVAERDGIPDRLLSHLSAEDYVAASMEVDGTWD